jgi:hypothetical protein
MEEIGYREMWITYGTRFYSAKELTVLPKRTVTIKDAAAYGLILTQGYGTFGQTPVATPSMILDLQSTVRVCLRGQLYTTFGGNLQLELEGCTKDQHHHLG